MSDNLILKQISSLEKVFLEDDYNSFKEIAGKSALKGERISYQILFAGGKEKINKVEYRINADDKIKVSVRLVENVPCSMPAYRDEALCDEHYINTKAGLYPDILRPIENQFNSISDSCHSIFVTLEIAKNIEKGKYPVELFFSNNGEEYKKTFTVNVLDACILEQDIIYTQWFHADCIANYYGYKAFSEEHWEMIEKFVKLAAHTGINTILTPVFTPPLDTEVGGERLTVQLVGVKYKNGEYSFDFSKLGRWIDMCLKNGIKYFEVSHLFTQWGTGCTPKIEADTDDGIKKIFGWHVKADTKEYREFIAVFLPQLVEYLKEKEVYENTFFHVSDEPDYEKHIDCYKMEREMLDGLIPPEKIMDAMSHYEFVEDGLVKTPIVCTNAIDKFVERGIKNIWAYYCCIPSGEGYSNRFIAMPSGRNRIIGVQLYKYNINGFLHWGYNFYNSQLSRRCINPFLVTDADEAFPSGDGFSVYPAEDGPIESIRSAVFYEALEDNMACKLLEEYIGRTAVNEIIEEDGKISFNQYPRTNDGVERIRERINDKLEEVLGR